MNIILVILIYGVLFVLVEFLSRISPFSKEFWRKIIHILAGVFSASLPFLLSLSQIFFLGIFFALAMLVSKNTNVFKSIHAVSRRSYGEVFFPLSISIVALAFPNKILYVYAVLILSLSDGLAGLAGQKFGTKKYNLFSEKSYVGSLTFFITSALIGTALLQISSLPFWQSAAWGMILAIPLTIAEGILPLGLDNLLLPPLAALLFILILSKPGV